MLVWRTSRDLRQKPASLQIAVVWTVLLSIAVLLAGCSTSPIRTPRMSEAWSKGLPLGLASLNNQVALDVDPEGRVVAAWVGMDQDIRLVRLNERAGVEVDRPLDLALNHPQGVRIGVDDDGQVHLVWLDRVDRALQVLYARFSPEGDVLQPATQLSAAGLQSGRLAVALDSQGRTLEVFWSDTFASHPGIYHAALSWAGSLVVPAELLIAEGLAPSVATDRQGYIHLAWREEGEDPPVSFHYAIYDPQRRLLGPSARVSEPVAEASMIGGPAAGARFQGPQLGLSRDSVYLAWMLEVRQRGDLTALTFFQTFPQPALESVDRSGRFFYTLPEVVSKPVQVRGGDPSLTGDPAFAKGQPDDQVLVCYTQAEGPRNLKMLQSAVVHLSDPQLGMDIVSATTGASLKPNVAVDGQQDLHLVWIDTAGFDRYRVLYASTAPQVQEVLNPVTVGEALSQVLELGFGALTLIGFLPLYLIWAVPALLALLVFWTVTQGVDLSQPQGRVALACGIGVHGLVKVTTAGGALNRLSTGGWVTAAWQETVIRWLVPLLITALAAWIVRIYVRKSGTVSLFGAFFIFVLIDALLFTLIYLTPLLLWG